MPSGWLVGEATRVSNVSDSVELPLKDQDYALRDGMRCFLGSTTAGIYYRYDLLLSREQRRP